MAVEWIKVTSNLPEKEEVLVMAERLGLTPEATCGHLLRWFIWLDKESRDGHVRVTRLSMIDGIARHAGFGQALAEVGWLDRSSKGVVIPNWSRHNGKGAKVRALAMDRKRDERAAEEPEPSRSGHAKSVTRDRDRSSSPSEKKKARSATRTPKCDMPSEFTPEFIGSDVEIVGWNDAKGFDAALLPLHFEYFHLAVEKTDLKYAGMKGWRAAFKKAVLEDWAGLRKPRTRAGEAQQTTWLEQLTGGGDGRVIEGTSKRDD